MSASPISRPLPLGPSLTIKSTAPSPLQPHQLPGGAVVPALSTLYRGAIAELSPGDVSGQGVI